jgi:DNA repair exonuclease SbcCD ATPase subunit
MEMKATEEAAEEEINAVMQEVEQLKAEKAAAATEKEEVRHTDAPVVVCVRVCARVLWRSIGSRRIVMLAHGMHAQWEAMITEEVDTLEKSVAEAKAALAQSEEQRAALDGNLSDLQAEKAEADEYLAEFEQASIDENQQLQDKVDALTAENKAAVAAKEAAEAEVEETIAMADEEMSSAVAAQEAKAAEQVAAMQAKHEQ